jgi:two-component system response regulator YesN
MNHSKLFWQFFRNYTLIFLIPLLFTGLFISYYLHNVIEREIINRQTEALYQSSTLLVSQISQLEEISIQLSLDKETREIRNTMSAINNYTMIRELKKYPSANRFIKELILFSSNNNFFYSSSEMFSANYFFNHILGDFLLNPLLKNRILTGREVSFMTLPSADHSRQQLILVIHPFPYNARYPVGKIIYIIEETSLESLFILSGIDNVEIKKDNEVLYKSGTGHNVPSNKDEWLRISLKNEKGWDLTSQISNQMIKSKYKYTRQLSSALLLSVLIFGLIASYFFSRWTYLPIRNIHEILVDQDSENELIGIRIAAEKMVQSDRDKEFFFKSNKRELRDALIFNLLNGRKENEAIFEKAEISFTLPAFIILMVDLPDFLISNGLDRRKIIDDLRQESTSELTIVGIPGLKSTEIVLIINTSYKKMDQTLIHIDRLKDYINDKYGLFMTVGSSSLKSKLKELPDAYNEALTALNYYVLMGSDRIISYSMIELNKPEDFQYPYEELDEMEKALTAADEELIMEQLTRIHKRMKDNPPPLILTRQIFYHILNLVIDNIRDWKWLPKKSTQIPDIMTLGEISTYNDMIFIIRETITRLFVLRKEVFSSSRTGEIASYIKIHFKDPNLSLQQLSDLFNINISTISASFKNELGISFSEYITNLRMEEARTLLKNGNKPIKEIVRDVGWTDASSFIRIFRQKMGTTPGRWRQKFD